MLDSVKREKFHSNVAKLLYLAKRGRPDILLAVNFLTTRVSCSTAEDWQKLDRVMKYLHGTLNLNLCLSGSKGLLVNAYIDASYAVHSKDGKSHTGVVISLGQGAAYVKSSKQKVVSKSSTEAELIAVSDGLSQVLWTRYFLQEQGFDVGPISLHQDNKSAIVLEEKGRSNAGRSKHINIRYFFVKSKVEGGEVKLVYTPTESMIADYFTKPLQGSLFLAMRDIIMGRTSQG